MIVGIDEVGRGAWAGPLCIAAVALGDASIDGLTDSKKLSEKRRTSLNLEIKRKAALVGIGWVSARDIDAIGMSKALKLAAYRAFKQIDCPEVTQIIIDGTILLLDDPRATTMKQADLLVPSVSAASIIAKVARDEYMKHLDVMFPVYGFAKHVGYGTAYHMNAIEEHHASPLHRMSFRPLSQLPERPAKQPAITDGQRAEIAAVDYLRTLGFAITETNWKTKWCEVDIIATRNKRIHFVEVKYRRNARHGDGLAAITPKKLKQMNFAAQLWLANHGELEATLSAMSLSGDDFRVDSFIETIA